MNVLVKALSYNLSEPLPSFTDKLIYGTEMLLIGVGTVFTVLIILMLFLLSFKFIFGAAEKKKAVAAVNNDAIIPATVQPTVDSDEEIVAVIAAAIAMAESESNGLKFKVVSFKRK